MDGQNLDNLEARMATNPVRSTKIPNFHKVSAGKGKKSDVSDPFSPSDKQNKSSTNVLTGDLSRQTQEKLTALDKKGS